jgi:uridylate kinase
VTDPDDETQDWIGIAATRLNGELLRGVFRDKCPHPVVTDPYLYKLIRWFYPCCSRLETRMFLRFDAVF